VKEVTSASKSDAVSDVRGREGEPSEKAAESRFQRRCRSAVSDVPVESEALVSTRRSAVRLAVNQRMLVYSVLS